jgi:succinyl-CoA synthetase beta subunit
VAAVLCSPPQVPDDTWQPANFLDVGGSAKKEQIAAAFKIISGDK